MVQTLLSVCLQTVAQNMCVLEKQACDLPAPLLRELLPHLNIFYLDRIEQAAHVKSVSSSLQFVWASKWRELNRTWRCKIKFLQEEEDWKQKCLESLFHTVVFRRTSVQNRFSRLSEEQVLDLAARYVRVLSLPGSARCENLRPVLSELELRVQSVRFSSTSSLLQNPEVLYVLHRLLDHGSVTQLVLKGVPDSAVFRWITSRCGEPNQTQPQTDSPDEDEGPSAPKHPRLDANLDASQDASQDASLGWLSQCCGVNSKCPVGQIVCLDLEAESLLLVSRFLPSWLRLQSLHLYLTHPLWDDDVLVFIESLWQLFLNPRSSLQKLSLGNISSQNLLEDLLTSYPALLSLTLDINLPLTQDTPLSQDTPLRQDTEFSLERLSLKSSEVQTVQNFPAVLQAAPKLISLHVTRIRHAHLLLNTLPESNPVLKVLILEDINLTDCHQEIIHLLENCSLEELTLKDCRLLERCVQKKDFLVPFVVAVRGLSSLRSLSLSQNRLATSVTELADLFLGDSPSKITKLDLSSNFILPADLLEFSERMEVYSPAQRIILDLSLNPLDRDLQLKSQAVNKLLPFCHILTDHWDSRSSMTDHVSVM